MYFNNLNFMKISKNIDTNDYYEFKSIDEADKWGRDVYRVWGNEFKKQYEKTENPLSVYGGNTFKVINKYKRNGECISSRYQNYADIIIPNAISSATRIPRNITVYRYIREMNYNFFFNRDNHFIYQEKGFLSTTLHIDKVFSAGQISFILKIFVPKETEAIYINSVENYVGESELELLINHNYYLHLLKMPYKINGFPCLECILSRNK